jgi:hypothetical protein
LRQPRHEMKSFAPTVADQKSASSLPRVRHADF